VQSARRARAYHLYAWRRIIESSFGHQSYYLMCDGGGGEVAGVLPLARVRSRLFGDFLVSLPYVNYGGVCANDCDGHRALVDAGVALARDLGVNHLELRTEAADGGELVTRSRKVSMRLRLPENADALWTMLGTKLRNKIKRAEREKVTIRFGREDELDSFYHVFAINMRDLGTPVYSKRLFASVLRELPESTWIGTVYLESEPVAAGLLVGFRESIEVPWASSLRRVNPLRLNTLLYWHLLKFSCEHGFRLFDFGRSSPGSGPYEFKRQWNPEAVDLHWQYWVPPGAPLPELSPDNPKFQLAVRMWQRLPVPLTRLIGPSIVRNIP
jgi:serine/alanine adding enzyme